MPVVGPVLRRIGGIPVYRKQDAPGDAARNEAMFEACRNVLELGGAVCLFPEGISHDHPRLQRLKSGAARIFLQVAARSSIPVTILPVGINFEEKKTFRSRVLILFGGPVVTEGVGDLEVAAPGRGVEELTSRIEKALASLLPGLDSWEELGFLREIQHLYLGRGSDSLAREAPVLKRFIDAYHFYRRTDPPRVQEIRRLWEAYRRQLARFALTDAQVDLAEAPTKAARFLFSGAVMTLLVLPLAALGLIVHFVPYHLCGWIERRFNRHPDQAATVKLMAGLALFPATYLLLLAVPLARWGWKPALFLVVLMPIAGWAALVVGENRQRLAESAGALVLALSRRKALEMIRRQRQRILDQVGEVIRNRPEGQTTRLAGDGGELER
jgi:glycerol-3-phosphate O-acyltransferase / dihydroxyacetone phosphate acyltransferase